MPRIEEHQHRIGNQPMGASAQLIRLKNAVREYLTVTAAYNAEKQIRDPTPEMCARVMRAEQALKPR